MGFRKLFIYFCFMNELITWEHLSDRENLSLCVCACIMRLYVFENVCLQVRINILLILSLLLHIGTLDLIYCNGNVCVYVH